MKRFAWTVICGFICIQLAGCSGLGLRTSTLRKPRVDQKVSGNRGFISGKPTAAPKEPAFTERKVYQVEVELPQWKQKERTQDRALWGNRGYISGGREEKERPAAEKRPVAKAGERISQILEARPGKKTEMRTYKVRKGDTLQKISRRFYGTTKKWALLYKANKDELKSPDSVYPGQVLVIPEAAEFEK
ncbi:MAG: LysM peptidoglycan-binding domain-containing protein [Candidatus Omnitrophica bacterium]|nr:LysM peptidoglycan-binding domain-containing protein [Candidatus Omnitrophota bacterium]